MAVTDKKRTTHCLARSEVDQIQRSSVLIRMMELPATLLTTWEQGFVAALTMFEGEVDVRLQKMEEDVALRQHKLAAAHKLAIAR